MLYRNESMSILDFVKLYLLKFVKLYLIKWNLKNETCYISKKYNILLVLLSLFYASSWSILFLQLSFIPINQVDSVSR